MNDILTQIIAHKRCEIAQQKQTVAPQRLRQAVETLLTDPNAHRPRSLRQALAASPTGIIAEFKRRSPSKGWINRDARVQDIIPAYQAAGAAALSILTDEPFFGGTLNDLRAARPLVHLPILRKDFILDPYQLLEARLAGADAVLLIAACLSPETCRALAAEAHALGLEVLLEVHTTAELSYIYKEIDVVGINNRNLGSFVTEVDNSFRLARQLAPTGKEPHAPLLVSESGLTHRNTLDALRTVGFSGFLIGETFMKTPAPGEALKTFITPHTPLP